MTSEKNNSEESSPFVASGVELPTTSDTADGTHKATVYSEAVAGAIPVIVPLALLFCEATIAGTSLLDTTTGGYDPNGNVYVPGGSIPGIWSTDYFLAITLGFGSFDFSTAKNIDIFWDLVVSRLGQAALAWVVYRVFRKSLLFSMERYPARYDTFVSMAYTTTTPTALWVYCRDLKTWTTRRPRPVRWILTIYALVFSTAYVLAFPTMTSAMTGYQAESVAMVPLHSTYDCVGQPLFNMSSLTQLLYSIRDGDRIGEYPNIALEYGTDLYWDTGNCKPV